MKIKNLLLGLMVSVSLTMVGCGDAKDTSDATHKQAAKKAEEKVDINEEIKNPISKEEAKNLIKDMYKKYGVNEIDLDEHGDNDGVTDDSKFYMFIEGYTPYAPEAATIIKVDMMTKELWHVRGIELTKIKEDEPLEDYLKSVYGEKNTKDIKKEQVQKSNNKKEEMGQCYDCGEYYPVSQMEFNGRSYHCGCVACEVCGTRMNKKDVNYVDGFAMCVPCKKWHNEEIKQYEKEEGSSEIVESCDNCGKSLTESEVHGIQASVYCGNCWNELGY